MTLEQMLKQMNAAAVKNAVEPQARPRRYQTGNK
jgi:hypothetical protein